jgi:hypothetical protein
MPKKSESGQCDHLREIRDEIYQKGYVDTAWTTVEFKRNLRPQELKGEYHAEFERLLAISGEYGKGKEAFLLLDAKTHRVLAKVRRKSVIHRPPGFAVDRFARFVFDKKTYQLFFEQTIIDHRGEHFEALEAGDFRKAKWIAIRCNLRMLTSMVFSLVPASVFDLFVRLTRARM